MSLIELSWTANENYQQQHQRVQNHWHLDDEENYVVVTRLKSQTTLYYDTLFYGKHFHQRPRQRNNHKDDEKVVLRNVLQEIADDYLGAVGRLWHNKHSLSSWSAEEEFSTMQNTKFKTTNTKYKTTIQNKNTKYKTKRRHKKHSLYFWSAEAEFSSLASPTSSSGTSSNTTIVISSQCDYSKVFQTKPHTVHVKLKTDHISLSH